MTPKDKKASPTSNTGIVILISIAVGLGCFFVMRKSKTIPAQTPSELSAKESVDIPSSSNDQPSPTTNRNAPKLSYKKSIKRFVQASNLQIKFIDLKKSDDSLIVPVLYRPHKAMCRGGEVESIEKLVPPGSKLIMTIESAEGGGEENSYSEISVDALRSNSDHKFVVKRPGNYNLYICTDQAKKRSCGRKRFEDFSGMTERYQTPFDLKADLVFFFQNIVVSDKGAYAYNSLNTSPSYIKNLKDFLSKNVTKNHDGIDAGFKRSEALKSLPLESSDNKFIASFVHNDPECLKRPAQPIRP